MKEALNILIYFTKYVYLKGIFVVLVSCGQVMVS